MKETNTNNYSYLKLDFEPTFNHRLRSSKLNIRVNVKCAICSRLQMPDVQIKSLCSDKHCSKISL